MAERFCHSPSPGERSIKTLSLVVLACLTQAAASFALGPRPPVQPADPLQVTRDVQPPEKLSGAPPSYSAEAREAGLGGTVVLQAIIDEGGNVTDVQVLKELPMGLSEEAVKAVETWKFKPATKDGRAVRVRHVLTVNFVIERIPTDDPQELLRWIAAVRAGAPPAPDAARVRAIEDDVTADRSTLLAAAEWANDYEGESRAELLAWLGGEAWRRALQRPPADVERAGWIELGLAAENRAIGIDALAVEAMVYKHLLLNLQMESMNDPCDEERVSAESYAAIYKATMTSRSYFTSHRHGGDPPGVP
jgi:TonB family protein